MQRRGWLPRVRADSHRIPTGGGRRGHPSRPSGKPKSVRVLLTAAVLAVSVHAGPNGAAASPDRFGAAAGATRFAVIPSPRYDFALADERANVVVRSDVTPALSSRGLIAFARRSRFAFRVETRRLAATRGRVIASYAGPEAVPPSLAFSADGTKLAVAHPRGIDVVTSASGRRRSLSLPPGRYANPAFSPDGSRLAFVRTTGNGLAGTLRIEVQIAPVASGPPTTLHTVSNPYAFMPIPLFTPDGDQVVFIRDDAQLVTVSVDGGSLQPVGNRATGARLSNLLVLPDRSGYLIARTPEYGVADVWRVDTAGRPSRLTVTAIPPRGVPRAGTIALAVSPDATQVLLGRSKSLASLSLRGRRIEPLVELSAAPLTGYWLR
jgi:WD40-like Beta Propeller Repeat